MNVLKGVVMGLVVAGFCVLSSASFANDEMNDKDKIQILTEAAAALQSSNPTLAAKLTNFANEESKEMVEDKKADKKEEDKDDKIEKMEKKEMK